MRSGSSRLHNLLSPLLPTQHAFRPFVAFSLPFVVFPLRHSFPSFFAFFSSPSPPSATVSELRHEPPTTVWERRALTDGFRTDEGTRILFASVFSICSSLLLLRTINTPLKSYLSLFLEGIYKVSRGIFFPFPTRYRVAGSIGVYCMNYSSNICITGGGKVYIVSGVARVEDRKKKEKKNHRTG